MMIQEIAVYDRVNNVVALETIKLWRQKLNDDKYFVKICNVEWNYPEGSVSIICENAVGFSLKVGLRDSRIYCRKWTL